MERPDSGFDPLLDGWLYNSTLAWAALLLTRRACRRSADQLGWMLLALAAALWTSGDILWSILYSDPSVEVPIPSVSDWLWLVFYVPAGLAIAFFVRVHAGNARLGLWLDGLIGGLTVAGVASAFVLPPIIAASTGTALEVAVNLAYPAGDLLLLLLVVASTIILGRVSRVLKFGF